MLGLTIGSGKSTLLNIIGGIDQADEGYVSINGGENGGYERKKTDAIPPPTSGDMYFRCTI